MSSRTSNRLRQVYENAKKITFDDSDKFILFSDCHRGDGSWADDFAHNQSLFSHALNYYRGNRFTYTEIGDGDELWENSQFDDVKETHSVHPRCLVGIEINNASITLVKWYVNVKQDKDKGTLFIDRKRLVEPNRLQDFFSKI